jgi:hypothetical protein
MKEINNFIIFVLFYNNSNFTTDYCRGTAIANKLLFTYNNVICINYFDLHNYIITNSIIIFVRFKSFYRLIEQKNNILKYKDYNNIIIHDVIDLWNLETNDLFKKYIDIENIFDFIITDSSEYMNNIFKKFIDYKKIIYIPHHSDDRIKTCIKKNYELHYIGHKKKLDIGCNLFNNIKHLSFGSLNNNNGLKYFKNAYSCVHISYIEKNREDLYWHFVDAGKLFTALKCNSILICNRVPVYEEILGKNYEFFIEENEDKDKQILEIFNKAKQCLLNEEMFNDYKKKYYQIKMQFELDYLIKKYIEFIENLNKNKILIKYNINKIEYNPNILEHEVYFTHEKQIVSHSTNDNYGNIILKKYNKGSIINLQKGDKIIKFNIVKKSVKGKKVVLYFNNKLNKELLENRRNWIINKNK